MSLQGGRTIVWVPLVTLKKQQQVLRCAQDDIRRNPPRVPFALLRAGFRFAQDDNSIKTDRRFFASLRMTP
jgi:hypothetical protein